MNRKILLRTLGFGVLGLALAVIWFAWRTSQHTPTADNVLSTNQSKAVDQMQLTTDYETAVRALMPQYQAALASWKVADINTVKQQLLDLHLSATDRDAHVALVVLLDSRENGITAADAQMQLTHLQTTYPWLTNK